MRNLLGLTALLLFGCEAPETRQSTPTHYDVGAIHRAVTTGSAEAQVWFDRGLGLTYGFNHGEAIACFERAAAADPGCAMAYWGKAYSLGPNYNDPAPSPEAIKAARQAIASATQAIDNESAAEKALIDALRARYPGGLDNKAYAEQMRYLHRAHPDDADICALTGEALMQLRPWGLWSPEGKMAPETPEIRTVLEGGLRRWPNHPALCHLYIHAMEAGPEVEKAVPAARALERRAAGLGHLAHMPSHIYVWTGRYEDVIRVNVKAVEIDDAYVMHGGRNNLYTAYRIHNYHFVAYGAMWDGQRALALEFARAIPREIPKKLAETYPDVFDVFHATPYHVMVRFGMWDDILREQEPAYLASKAVWRYARGIAHASLGNVEAAEKEQHLFLQAKAAVPGSRALFNNPVSEILGVAEKFLDGEIEYRKGNYDEAFKLLGEAVRLDEQLNYDEPWGWMEPTRHALGALLTEQGQFEAALKVYEENLERYPNNGWALHGKTECLQGLGRNEEAAAAKKSFDEAWIRSDVVIPGSCFCKTK
ncbi:MAG: tetratricopeptide repeat protein [Planctomycetota bacterium]|jgi:tetratricopeptide (TPR) repeat protein